MIPSTAAAQQSAEEVLSKLPESARMRGDITKGEIELDPPEGGAELLYEDNYIAVLRDQVKFPGGASGRYLRIIEKSSFGHGIAGIVVVPRLEDKFVLLRTFRHPTRSWEIEFPRGFSDAGQSPEENARREAREELGHDIHDLKYLGSVKCNTGLLASTVLVYEGTLQVSFDDLCPDDKNEAIDHYIIKTRQELTAMIREGKISDGFTLSALSLSDSQS
jgi:ADP-ribose pyrophosphatase